jgi:protocatechuate 3,4-dioxygenase beta subunit
MRAKVWLVLVCLALSVSGAAAQSTNGTISGRVTDSQGLPLPGVTVIATSPNLQGARETVTSENGDYILTLLPPGTVPNRLRSHELSATGAIRWSGADADPSAAG